VRVMIGQVLERYGDKLAAGDFVHARQVNFETIHNHEVLAERSGTVGELREERESGEFSGRYRELRDWLQNGA
jgi:GTP cyclohydrolase IV